MTAWNKKAAASINQPSETEAEDTRTLQELAQEVLLIQNAVNLTAIARGFGRAMKRLRRLNADGQGGDQRHHPVAIAWMSKVCSFHEECYTIKIWDEVERIAKG